MPARPPFPLFVYGTLVRGGSNHAAFCAGASQARPARVRGRLRLVFGRYPILEIPAGDALGRASVSLARDIDAAWRVAAPAASAPTAGDCWLDIRGELLLFPRPGQAIPPIDLLEGACLDGPSDYDRVLVPLAGAEEPPFAAWTYVTPRGTDFATLPLLPGVDRWSED